MYESDRSLLNEAQQLPSLYVCARQRYELSLGAGMLKEVAANRNTVCDKVKTPSFPSFKKEFYKDQGNCP